MYFIISVFVQFYFIRMVITSGWLFFVLLNSYYCGAMTMFFSNEITIPFKTTRDVIMLYPDWKLKIMKGTEMYIQVQRIIILYSCLWY
jgi:hypothetical protein